MIQRSNTWLTQELDGFLRDHIDKAFEWGVNDCCLFSANAVQAMTGVDIADDFRGKYTDQESAFALIHAVTGGDSILAAIEHCTAKHSLREWVNPTGKYLPLMAQRGDLVAARNNDNDIIAGIVDLSGRYVACMGDKGIVRLPLSSIVRAWHI